jgi:hypothetical protein
MVMKLESFRDKLEIELLPILEGDEEIYLLEQLCKGSGMTSSEYYACMEEYGGDEVVKVISDGIRDILIVRTMARVNGGLLDRQMGLGLMRNYYGWDRKGSGKDVIEVVQMGAIEYGGEVIEFFEGVWDGGEMMRGEEGMVDVLKGIGSGGGEDE